MGNGTSMSFLYFLSVIEGLKYCTWIKTLKSPMDVIVKMKISLSKWG